MSLWTDFEAAAQLHAERPVFAPDTGVSYRGLHESVLERAAFFQGRGVQLGDRMAVFAANCPEYLELYLVAAAMGAILVPLNVRLSEVELRAILEDAEPKWLVRGPLERAAIDAAAHELPSLIGCVELEGQVEVEGAEVETVAWRDVRSDVSSFACADINGAVIAQLYYTSGTTGRSKGVPLSHANVSSHARAAVHEFGLDEGDVWGHFAPMFHLADAWACFAISFAGGRHAFLPRFTGRAAYKAIERAGVTLTNLVPTMLNSMVHEPDTERGDVSSLRMVLSGGAPIAPELVQRIEALFDCAYAQTYGLTETSPYLTVSLPSAETLQLPTDEQARMRARTGRAFGGVELRVVDVEGKPVAHDDVEVGEIQARGEWVFSGYWRRPDESAAAFTEGWFRTGDLATIDARGSLNIVDRKKDVILSGGETIYSTEIENAIYTHQLVREVAVFGLPDDHWGEVVSAAVVLRQGEGGRELRVGELLGHCRLFLAGYKLPRLVKFIEELPKSGAGKIQKRLLRERFLDLKRGEFDFVHEATSRER